MNVAIRVKPHGSHEHVAVWAQADAGDESRCTRVVCHRGYLLEEHSFSRVFGPQDDNGKVFQDLQGPALTASVCNGVNETLFAYGQTGAGKTHTIFGGDSEAGLLQHFVYSIFDSTTACAGSTVHVCCYEVLGDTLTDLVNPDPFIEMGEIHHEDVAVDELFLKTSKFRYQIVRVATAETCMDLLHDARMNRASGVSSCNSHSSRSHAVVHIFVQRPTDGTDGAASPGARVSSQGAPCLSSTLGALTLVDLAGAEKEHENPSEHGRKSARILNTSLSSLNRLLRKLQSNGGLDESERRQSVLNKCLWEYLRPGCGIALIFCVSPLMKHRVITLSTLAMATDSKLIHNRRRSQVIQIPTAAPAAPVQSTPCSSASPGGTQTSSPSSVVSEWRQRPGTAPSSTATVPASRSGSSRGWHDTGGASGSAASRPSREVPSCSINLTPVATQDAAGATGHKKKVAELEAQNQMLRRKLGKVRSKSQEHCSRAKLERKQLRAENIALQHECESLRALFIRQQQQQIAFWTGPFMEMIAPKDTVAKGGEADRDECVHSLWREREYWCTQAADLRQRQESGPHGPPDGSQRKMSELSTSQSQQEDNSEFSNTQWSDSCSIGSARSHPAEL